jgi:hypothetical protein
MNIEVAARDGDENFVDNRFPLVQRGRSKQEASPQKEYEERTNCVRHANTTRTVHHADCKNADLSKLCFVCSSRDLRFDLPIERI